MVWGKRIFKACVAAALSRYESIKLLDLKRTKKNAPPPSTALLSASSDSLLIKNETTKIDLNK